MHPRAWGGPPGGSRTVGSYGLLDIIGEGGMGIVYRAEHIQTRRQVAIKTVLLPNERHLESLRREIFALRRIRHPGVVRILDDGVEKGVPWYAMELLRGESLSDYNRRLWAVPSAHARHRPERQAAAGRLDRALEIVQHLCTSLAVLHAEGIVHRDLKAANVLLRDDGTPVLIDFGLMWRFPSAQGRAVLDIAVEVAGTAGYMAPEQIAGDVVDARADIYSVGCILYELVTGQLPHGNEPLTQRLIRSPPPPSQRVAGVPPAIDALLMRLLERRARDRLGQAADVVYAIDAILAPDSPRAPRSISPRAYAYRPALIGRDDALAALRVPLDELQHGRGSCVLVRGESGIGKTSVAMALARKAAVRGLQVITGAAMPLGGSDVLAHPNESPLHPFGRFFEVVADRCLAEGREGSERLLGAHGKVLAPYEPRFATLPGQCELLDPPELPAQAARERLFDALADTLAAFAADRPVLLLLDDLQWADELSLQFLARLDSDYFARHALLVLGTYRPEEANETLVALATRPHVVQVQLGPLDQRAVAAITTEMLGLDQPPPSFVHVVAERAEGNPFFAGEYVRAAVDAGLLVRDAEGHWHMHRETAEVPLPRTLAALVHRRLEGLSHEARALLEAASVIGRNIDIDFLAAVAGTTADAQRGAMRELVARQILEEPEPGQLRFLHDKLREHTYEQVHPARRRATHLTTARVLEARGTADGTLPRLYPRLAHHYGETDEHEKTLEYLEKAGEGALATFANREAVRFFSEAVALDDRTGARTAPVRRARWERQMADAYYALGALDAVVTHCQRALRWLGESEPSSPAGRLVRLSRDAALQLLHRLRPDAFVAPDADAREAAREAAAAMQRLAVRHYFSFDALPMVAASVRAVNLAERAGPGVSAATSYGALAMALGIGKLRGLGGLYSDAARRTASANGDRPGLAFALYTRAAWRIGDGAWYEVRALCEEALQVASADGATPDPQDVAICETFLAHVAFYTGQFEQSRRMFDELAAKSRARGNEQYVAWGLYASARALIPLGQIDTARAMLLEAHALLEHQIDVPSRIICPGLLAMVQLEAGDLAGAEQYADTTEARTRGNAPTVFATVAGYAAVAEVRLARLQHAMAHGGDVRAARGRLRSALFALGLLALNIPIGRPAYHRVHGRALAATGWTRSARRALRRALAWSRRLAMPYEEALAALELAAVLPCGDERRARAAAADKLLAEMRCPRDLERLRLVG